MQIAIPLFPRFTALDGIGPYEVLQRIPGFDITFIGHSTGEVRSEMASSVSPWMPNSKTSATQTSSCFRVASAHAIS